MSMNKSIINQIYKMIQKDLIKQPSSMLMDKSSKKNIWKYGRESHVPVMEEDNHGPESSRYSKD